MRRANQGMRIVMHERDSELLFNEGRKAEVQEKKKPILLGELQKELKHLDEMDDTDFTGLQDPYQNDSTLDRLQVIAKEAGRYELKEIEKLCKLAIGKRILNIELKRKKEEHNSKLLKKQKIELFFRENRIKRYNYDHLIEQKLKESTMVVRAYENGKGFIESTSRYRDYQKALTECDYIRTIKQVNKIFYNNYSSLAKGKLTLTDLLLKIVWIPIAIFICLAVTLPFTSFLYEQVILMGLLGIILLILLYVSLKTFCDKPNDNNQIEQTIEDVQQYFEELNQRFQERGSGIEWNVSRDFMYLQVTFHNGFPT